MLFHKTPIKGAYIIDIEKREDERGFFARSFCQNEFSKYNLETTFVQTNISYNKKKGTLRGMHFQKHPYEEDKVLRCTNGAIFDVIVDIRKESPTYKQWFGIELSNKNQKSLYIPKGCAHGYLTLTDKADVTYMVSQFYTPKADTGLRYNDPLFGIEWPKPIKFISKKDESFPDFKEENI